jgi:diguanylate cyclase
MVPALDHSDAALRDPFASTLEGVVGSLLIPAPELRDEALALGEPLRNVRDTSGIDDLAAKLRNLIYRPYWMVDDQAEIRSGLFSLLELLLKNIGEMVPDDRWKRGRIDSLRALCDHPLTARELDEVERRLREVIARQGSMRGNIDDAKHQIKLMLAGFADAKSGFGEEVEDYAEVIAATHSMRATTEKSRSGGDNMRNRVRAAETGIERLQVELGRNGEKMRHAPLTGALNRKGWKSPAPGKCRAPQNAVRCCASRCWTSTTSSV